MLAVEVLKIWMGRFYEDNGEVDAFVLTFDGGFEYLDYRLEYPLSNSLLKTMLNINIQQ